jgi:hypothetical protein
MVSVKPAPTNSSATQEYHATLRPETKSTSGAITNTSPRINNCMKGILTPAKVKDKGTVKSSNEVPIPDKTVHRVGQGSDTPHISR